MDGLQDRRPGQDQISAVWANAGLSGAFGGKLLQEAHGRDLAVLAPHPQAINLGTVIPTQTKMQARNARYGPRGSDKMGLSAVENGPHGISMGEGGDANLDVLDHGSEPSLALIGALGEALSKTDHAHRQGDPSPDGQGRRHKISRPDIQGLVGQIDPRQLGRSSAYVYNQSRQRIAVEQVQAACDRQLRLFSRANDLQPDASFLGHALDKFRAIAGRATGLSGDGLDPQGPAPLNFLGTDAQGGHRPVHRPIGQTP